MDTTQAKATGTDLQGTTTGANGGASGQDLQGSSPQTNGSNAAAGLNNLQSQGQITVQDVSNQIEPKDINDSGVAGPMIVAALLLITVVLLVMGYRKYLKKTAVATPLEQKPIKAAGAVSKVKPAVAKPATSAQPKKTTSKKVAPKKRNSAGRKKR